MEWRSRSYLQLIKPGITLSNSIAALAGALFGVSQAGAGWVTAGAVTIGVALLIMSACVVNNITDRDIDSRMKRTKKRVLVGGDIALSQAVFIAIIAGATSVALLLFATNTLTLVLGGIAFVWYTVIYAAAKRTTPLSTIVGTVPGSLPAVAGYVAVTGRLDMAAVVLFVAMTSWQLAHFYAIAIFRRREYAAAGLPVWPVRYGVPSTMVQIRIAMVLFIASAPLLVLVGAGVFYALATLALGIWWMRRARSVPDSGELWAKKVFFGSLFVLLAWLGLVGVGGFLP